MYWLSSFVFFLHSLCSSGVFAETKVENNTTFGSIPTLNKYGLSDFLLDPYTIDFLIFSTESPKHVLEVGAEFGRLSLEVIRYGGSAVVNDLDPRHIHQIEEKIPKTQRQKIDFVVGAFPLETHFQDGTFDAIFIRVMQFLSGELIEKGLSKAFKWLKPGGRIYIIAPTIYMPSVPKHVQDAFKRKRKHGEMWPGVGILSREVFPMTIAENMPSKVHLMDMDVLMNALFRSGFDVQRVGYYDRFKRHNTEDLHDRNGVGIVGVKSGE